jgi:hypothetical protein
MSLCNQCGKRPKYKNRGKCYECAYAHQKALRMANGTYVQKYDPAKYAASDKEKHKARVAVRNAIRNGRLVKATECSECGSDQLIEAHHEDYSKPLDVVWLCSTCHGRKHSGAESESSH